MAGDLNDDITSLKKCNSLFPVEETKKMKIGDPLDR
jgi:hypothetical protein